MLLGVIVAKAILVHRRVYDISRAALDLTDATACKWQHIYQSGDYS